MLYPREIVEEVRTSNDIVQVISSYLQLKQRGSSYFGLCPFHNESSPSFSVSTDKQLYHCFGCGASGNVISFIMAMENFDFLSAVRFLAERINYTLPEKELSKEMEEELQEKEKIYNMHLLAGRFFYDNLNSSEGENAKKYLKTRKIKNNTIRKFGLGFCSKGRNSLYKFLLSKGYTIDEVLKSGLVLKNFKRENQYFDRFFGRLMFPILDVTGKVVGFGGRIIDDGQPKYLNSSESIIFDKSKNLYGINFARKNKDREVILVEGYMDVIALHQAGFENTVASLGTAFNVEHGRLIRKYFDTVIIMFDSDTAGINATLRAIPILTNQGLDVKVLNLENSKDPDEFINKFGAEKLKDEIKKSSNYITYKVNLLRKKYNLNNVEEKIKFTLEVSKILSELNNEVLIDAYTNEISEITNISTKSIKIEINKLSEKIYNIEPIKIKKNLNYKEENKYKGLMEAEKNLINILVQKDFVYKNIKDIFYPSELSEDVYIKLLAIIYSMYENNEIIYPAELVNNFEKIEEQKIVSDIFNTAVDFKKEEEIKKAIIDHVKLIKIYNLENKRQEMLEENNIEGIQETIEEAMHLRNFKILFK